MKLDKNEILDAIFVIGTICFMFIAILSTLSADAFIVLFLAALVGTFWFTGSDEED